MALVMTHGMDEEREETDKEREERLRLDPTYRKERLRLGPMALFIHSSHTNEEIRQDQIQRDVQKRIEELEEQQRLLEAEERAKKQRLQYSLDEISDKPLKEKLARLEAASKAVTQTASRPQSRDNDGDIPARYRREVEALIETPKEMDWSTLQGQTEAVEVARRYVNSINRNYYSRPNGGLLLTGPGGVGKSTLAMIMASQMKSTLFKVPNGFAKSNTKLWYALFKIAEEKAPSIVIIDECDGVMSTRHTAAVPAIKDLWDPTNRDKPFVLLLGATNNPNTIEPHILTRFGKPVEFVELDAAAHRAIMEGRIKTPFVLDLDDTEWGTLIEMFSGQTGRWINQICSNVAGRVEDACYGTTIRPITLADFQAELSTDFEDSMTGEAMSMFKDTFCKKYFKDGRTADSIVVSLRFMIDSLLTDAEMRALGAKDVKSLRHNKTYSIKSREAAFVYNLDECLQGCFPRCERFENTNALEKWFWTGHVVKIAMFKDNYFNPSGVKARTKGYYWTGLELKRRDLRDSV